MGTRRWHFREDFHDLPISSPSRSQNCNVSKYALCLVSHFPFACQSGSEERNLLATNLRATSLPRSGTSRPRARYQAHTRNSHEVPIQLPCCGCIASSARFLPILPVQPLDSIDLVPLGKDSGSAYRGSNPCLPAIHSSALAQVRRGHECCYIPTDRNHPITANSTSFLRTDRKHGLPARRTVSMA